MVRFDCLAFVSGEIAEAFESCGRMFVNGTAKKRANMIPDWRCGVLYRRVFGRQRQTVRDDLAVTCKSCVREV